MPRSAQRDSVYNVSSVGINPEYERKRRMIRYTVAMTIRVVCLVLGMFVQGWLMWVCFIGAILLPYIAVILANDVQVKSDAQAPLPVLAERKVIESSEFRVVDPQDK